MAKEGKDMDKKLNTRCGSVAPEAKGKDYNGKSSNNRHQRFHGKRRDVSTESSLQSKVQPPFPKQKNKVFDKRGRGKQNWNGRRDEVTEARRAEFGSALQGSKKINLNHLLNFKMEPRGYHHEGRVSGQRGQWHNRNKWGNHKHLKYNKEQFLQANCQFVVKSSEDYTINLHDADTLVNWDLVEQVRLLGHEVPSCPICLYPPSAAQITRCGHIFCWSCILHYLALSDKAWRKCPICYESVIRKDLKSVIATEQPLYKPGDEISMCLMRRQRGSVIAQPVRLTGDDIEELTSPYNILESKAKTCFVKLLTASSEEVKYLILSSERAALLKQNEEIEDELECSFIQAASDMLKEREETLSGSNLTLKENVKAVDHIRQSETSSTEDENVIVRTLPEAEECVVYASAFSDEEEGDIIPAAGVDDSALGVGHVQKDKTDISEENAKERSVPLDAEPMNNIGRNIKSTLYEGSKIQPHRLGEIPTTTEPQDSPKHGPVIPSSGDPSSIKSNPLTDTKSTRDAISESPTESERDILSTKPAPRFGNKPPVKTHTYYFYQSDDGQPIFIHPLNIRCLIQEYGSLDKCPLTITAKIVEIEHMSMNEDIRHRLRYITHLPLTCNFAVCELDLKPPIISEGTSQIFQDDFLKRKKARDRKVKEENRRERKIQIETDKMFGIYPAARYSLKSSRQFPSFGPSSTSSTDEQLTISSDSITSSPGVATPPSTSLEEDLLFPVETIPQIIHEQGPPLQPSSVPSFAQMLRSRQSQPMLPKKVHSRLTTVPVQSDAAKAASDESENEDYVPVPQYRDAFSDAIQDALDKVALSSAAERVGHNQPVTTGAQGGGGGGGRKNKKGRKKQHLLFSTAGPRFK